MSAEVRILWDYLTFYLARKINLVKIYESISEASKAIGIAPKTIRDVANGKYKHGGGFCWKYADQLTDE